MSGITSIQKSQPALAIIMPALKTTPRIVELAAIVSKSVGELQTTLDSRGIPSPSFDEDAPTRLPDECNKAQDAVLDAAKELYDLLLEPTTLILKNSSVRCSVNMPIPSY
jgi:hypothetical protein